MTINVGWQRFLYLYIYAFLIIAIGLLWTYGISLFSLHPVFAVFAWVISTGGTLSYRLWQKDSVPHARRRHRYMQQLACVSYAISLAGIVLSRWAGGKNLLSWSWHSVAGYLSMAAIGSQIVVRAARILFVTSMSPMNQIGRLKFDAIDHGERRFKWHGSVGHGVQYLTTLTLVLGVCHVMGRSLDSSFSWCILFTVGCVFLSWFFLMRENPIWRVVSRRLLPVPARVLTIDLRFNSISIPRARV